MTNHEPMGSKEACRVLDVDRATLTRWAAAGRVVVVHKLPGRNGAFLFDRDDVARLAAERAQAAGAVSVL